MTQWYIFETMTGRILAEFVPSSGSWSERLNEPDSVSVTVPIYSTDEQGRDWRNLATPWKHSLAVEESGRYFGGPIQPHSHDAGSDSLQISASGVRGYFARRNVLPPEALYTSLVKADGSPEDALDTNLSGFDLGTIGKRLVEQSVAWPGGGLPIRFEPDRKGSNKRSYLAIDLKRVDEALNQLTGVVGGPDFAFVLRRASETHFEWLMKSGTETRPQLGSTDALVWDLSASDSSGSGLSVDTNPQNMCSLSWATGGRSDDRVLVSRQYDRALVDDGFPLLEAVDTSHTSVSEQATLDGWAKAPLRTGRRPAEFRSFKASLHAPPWLSEYSVGDFCELAISGDRYTPDGLYRHRILEISGDESGDWVDVTLGEVFNV